MNEPNWLCKIAAKRLLEELTLPRLDLETLGKGHDFYFQGGRVYMKETIDEYPFFKWYEVI